LEVETISEADFPADLACGDSVRKRSGICVWLDVLPVFSQTDKVCSTRIPKSEENVVQGFAPADLQPGELDQNSKLQDARDAY